MRLKYYPLINFLTVFCFIDYVGWLYSGEGSSGPFASYPGVKGRSKLEFVFRSPASLEKANKVTRRIKRKIPTEVDMTLIAFKVQGESTACGLTLVRFSLSS